MGSPETNVFGSPGGATWRSALLRAALIDGVLVLFSIGALASPMGADNPLGIYAAVALQFPTSLLTLPLYRAAEVLFNASETHALMFAAATIAGLQYLLIVLLVRRPWRRAKPL
jgi:hypothetical protein